MIIKRSNQKIKNKKNNSETLSQDVSNEIANIEKNTVEETNSTDNLNDFDAELFNIEEIDFTQRQERRRGSRRRGYRRIDDRNLVSRAQEEAENIKKSAFEEGYRLGLEKANSDIENFRNELSNFMNAKQEVFEYIAPDILEISVDIAKKVIKRELESDPQIIINTIIDILRGVSKNEPKVTIKVHPQSVQIIKDTIPTITYQYGIESKLNIISDPSIEEGGCVLQTNNGIVDASIDTQIEIIKKVLKGIS